MAKQPKQTKQESIARAYEQRGGFREGAGRPKGPDTVIRKVYLLPELENKVDALAARSFVEKERPNFSHALNAILKEHFGDTSGTDRLPIEVEQQVKNDAKKIAKLEERIESLQNEIGRKAKLAETRLATVEEFQAKIEELEWNLSKASRSSELMNIASKLGIDLGELDFTAERGGRPRVIANCFSEADIAAMDEEKREMVVELHSTLLGAAACIAALKKGGKE